jgi:hypothetical protein
MLDGAKQQWALENKKSALSTPTSANLTPYIGRGGGQLPTCPIDSAQTFDSSYEINDVGTAPSCKLGGGVSHLLQ